MALIDYKDYFDFDSLKAAIKEAESTNKEFGNTVDIINKRIKESYDGITKELKDYVSVLSNFNVNQKNAVQGISETGAASDALIKKQQQQKQIIADITAANDLLTKSINDLKLTQKALEAEYNSLGNTEAKDIARKKEIEATTGKLTAAITAQTQVFKAAKTVVDAADGSYNRLSQELKEVGLALRALPNAFDPVTGKLNKQNAEAVALNAKYLQLTTSLKTADAGMGNFFRNVGNYDGTLGKLTEGFGHFASSLLLAVGIIPGLFGLVKFLEESVEEFNKEQVAITQFQNILKNIGREDAFDRLREKAHALAEEFKTFEDKDIIQVFQQLIQYGKLTENQINQLLPVIINFATITGQSLPDATNTLIKSLEGNNRGLKQFGINIRDAKNTTEAFSLVMNELAPRVENAAKAFGEQTAGQIKKTEVQIQELKEEIGQQLQPAIKLFYSTISDGLKGIPQVFDTLETSFSSLAKTIGLGIKEIYILATQGQSGLTAFLAATNADIKKGQDDAELQQNKVIAHQQAISVATDAEKKSIADQNKLLASYTAALETSKQKALEVNKANLQNTTAGKEATKNLINDLEIVQALQDSINAQTNKKVLGLGDPNDPFSPKNAQADADRKKRLFEEEIQREEQLVKQEFDYEVLIADKLLSEKKITDADFQLSKYNASVKYATDASAIENKKLLAGYQVDLSKLKEFQNFKLQAQNDYIKAAQKATDEARLEDIALQQKAIEDEANLRISSLTKEKDLILSDKRKTDFYRHALEVEYLDSIDKITIDSLNRRAALELDTAKKNALLQQAALTKIAIEARDKQFKTVTEPQDFRDLGIRFLEDQLNAKKAINAATLQDQLDTLEKEKRIYEIYGEDVTAIDLKIAETRKAIVDDIFNDFSRNLQALANIAGTGIADAFASLTTLIQDSVETGKASLEDLLNTAGSVGNAIVDQLNQADERRIQNLEKEKDHELTIAGNNAAAQQAISERFAREEAKIKRKEAVNNKINALFQIAINTAVAASKTLGETGIFGLPLLPIIIGLGAAEAALVLAQPLPSFEKGTEYAKKGPAVVDEAGSELIVDRHGNLKEVGGDGPRITYLDEGDKVYTHSKTKEILKDNARITEINYLNNIDDKKISSLKSQITNSTDEKTKNRIDEEIKSIERTKYLRTSVLSTKEINVLNERDDKRISTIQKQLLSETDVTRTSKLHEEIRSIEEVKKLRESDQTNKVYELNKRDEIQITALLKEIEHETDTTKKEKLSEQIKLIEDVKRSRTTEFKRSEFANTKEILNRYNELNKADELHIANLRNQINESYESKNKESLQEQIRSIEKIKELRTTELKKIESENFTNTKDVLQRLSEIDEINISNLRNQITASTDEKTKSSIEQQIKEIEHFKKIDKTSVREIIAKYNEFNKKDDHSISALHTKISQETDIHKKKDIEERIASIEKTKELRSIELKKFEFKFASFIDIINKYNEFNKKDDLRISTLQAQISTDVTKNSRLSEQIKSIEKIKELRTVELNKINDLTSAKEVLRSLNSVDEINITALQKEISHENDLTKKHTLQEQIKSIENIKELRITELKKIENANSSTKETLRNLNKINDTHITTLQKQITNSTDAKEKQKLSEQVKSIEKIKQLHSEFIYSQDFKKDKSLTTEQFKSVNLNAFTTNVKDILRTIEEQKILREVNLNTTLTNKIREGRQAEAVYTMASALRQSGLNNGHMADAFKEAVKDIPVYQTVWDLDGVHEKEKRRDGITKFRNTYNFGYKKK